jgi:hypothetical protein
MVQTSTKKHASKTEDGVRAATTHEALRLRKMLMMALSTLLAFGLFVEAIVGLSSPDYSHQILAILALVVSNFLIVFASYNAWSLFHTDS